MQQVNRLTAYHSDEVRVRPECLSAEQVEARRAVEFERLLAEYEADLSAFVFTLLPNWSDTEDVLQRTRIALWRKFHVFDTGTNFRAWALQVARYEVRNHCRVKQRDHHYFDDSLVEKLAETRLAMADDLADRRTLLERCLAKLRPSDRAIVQLCYGPDATTAKDAAEKLQRPLNTLYKALSRIRRTLSACVHNSHEAA